MATLYHSRIRFSSLQTLKAVLFLIGAAVFSSAAAATDVSEYRSTLLDLVHTMGEILYTIDPNTVDAMDDAVTHFESISDEELETVFMESLSLEQLQQQIETLESHLSAVRGADQTDEIEIPPVEVRPSVCAVSNPAIALAASAVATAAELVLATTEFLCFQEDGGFNAAVLCVGIELVNATAGSVSQGESFCLSEQHAAREETLLELTRGIGEHLNEFVDDVELSTRASQTSLDAVQHDFDTIQALTQDIQDALDAGYSQLDSQAAMLMQAVANFRIDLNQLASLLDDINFRSVVNLAELQDAGMRVADLQQRAQDIQVDLEAITAKVGNINAASTQLSARLNSDWTRQQRDRIAADLGNTQADSPIHALPSSAGGELELAREIVIEAIFGLQALGTVDTSQALNLVGMADIAYNEGQYPRAYLALKQAYQLLDGLSERR